MNRTVLVALLLALVLSLTPAAAALTECSAPDDNRCELWSATWDSGLNETPRGAYKEAPEDLAVHGDRVYTVGESHDGRADSDAFILASDATTGRLVWSRRFSGASAERPFDRATSVAISPDGSTIYVTGTRRYDFHGHGDIFLAAFSARSGRKLWAKRVHKGRAAGTEVEVARSGRAIYVTGSGRYESLERQVVTARYNRRGNRIWKRHFGGIGRDAVNDLTVRRSGIFVAASIEEGRRQHSTTLSYSRKGRLRWAAAPGEAERGHLYGGELRVANGLVYRFSTTQDLDQEGGPAVAEMYAFDVETGSVVWADVTTNVKTGFVSGTELALSLDGQVAYAVGLPGTVPGDHFERFDIRAYDAVSGAILWTVTYDHPTADAYLTDVVARDEGVVVGGILMPGMRRDLLTVGLSRESGSLIWSARYNPSDEANSEVNGGTMALGPNQSVIHAGEVMYGESESGSGYGYGNVAIAAYD